MTAEGRNLAHQTGIASLDVNTRPDWMRILNNSSLLPKSEAEREYLKLVISLKNAAENELKNFKNSGSYSALDLDGLLQEISIYETQIRNSKRRLLVYIEVERREEELKGIADEVLNQALLKLGIPPSLLGLV